MQPRLSIATIQEGLDQLSEQSESIRLEMKDLLFKPKTEIEGNELAQLNEALYDLRTIGSGLKQCKDALSQWTSEESKVVIRASNTHNRIVKLIQGLHGSVGEIEYKYRDQRPSVASFSALRSQPATQAASQPANGLKQSPVKVAAKG